MKSCAFPRLARCLRLNNPANDFHGPTPDETFNFITASSGITNFAADKFTLNTGGFTNGYAGTWAIAQSGNGLNLIYTGSSVAAIPEPSLFAALAGLGVLGYGWRRRQRA